ncbi:Ejaculatory bulb-specific protein 3 [Blattella germanica]|nr:Ejaculatory bulb-specific protein 3 [Blattella germanica]
MFLTLPDALETDCSKCSDKQKEVSDKVINFLIDNKKDDWKKLEAKYDPEGIYRKKYTDQKGGVFSIHD